MLRSLKSRLISYKHSPSSLILALFVYLAAAVTIVVLVTLIGYVLIKGVPNITPEQFAWEYSTENVSMMPAILNTILMTALSLIVAVPLGVGAAIFLVEYARRGSRFVSVVRITAETLSGIPSIVYGLFGYLIFVIYCGFGYTLLGGSLTLAIMILPTILRTTEESLKAVPDAYREGSFGLGAGRLRTVFKIVLPAAAPGIFTGIILSIGRIVGETAALIYTAGTIANVPDSLFDSTRTLSVHMYALWNEGLYTDQAYATAAVLLIIVVGINALSSFAAKKASRR